MGAVMMPAPMHLVGEMTLLSLGAWSCPPHPVMERLWQPMAPAKGSLWAGDLLRGVGEDFLFFRPSRADKGERGSEP